MTNPSIDSIARELEAMKIKYSRVSQENREELVAGVNGKHNTYSVKMIAISERPDIAVRVFNVVKVPQEKADAMLVLLNALNRKYRYLKFKMDSELLVDVEYDILQRTDPEEVGRIAAEILIRFVRGMDEVYPELMKQMWS